MFYSRRGAFGKTEKRLGRALSFLSPNTWTGLTLLFAFITAYFLAHSEFLIAAFLLAITAVTDVIDGSVARFSGRVTKKGAYLDTIVDRYTEVIIIFGMLFASLPVFLIGTEIWVILYIFGAMMTTYAKAAAKEKSLTQKELKGGLLERAERMALLFIGLLLAVMNPLYLTYIIILLAVLSNVTALQRIYKALQ